MHINGFLSALRILPSTGSRKKNTFRLRSGTELNLVNQQEGHAQCVIYSSLWNLETLVRDLTLNAKSDCMLHR
jgi:hypothetical protein